MGDLGANAVFSTRIRAQMVFAIEFPLHNFWESKPIALCALKNFTVWNVGDVQCTCAMQKTKASPSAQVGAQPVILSLGTHRIFQYISGSLCLPGAQSQPSVVVCCALKSYTPYWRIMHTGVLWPTTNRPQLCAAFCCIK